MLDLLDLRAVAVPNACVRDGALQVLLEGRPVVLQHILVGDHGVLVRRCAETHRLLLVVQSHFEGSLGLLSQST